MITEEFSLPTVLVEKAVAHAKDEHNIHLYPALVIELYEALVERRRVMIQQAKERNESPEGFGASMSAILDERYTQRDAREQEIYKGIKSSLGVVASGLKGYKKKPTVRNTRTATDRLKDQIVHNPEGEQSRFAV